MEQTVNIKVKLNILEPNVGMKFSKNNGTVSLSLQLRF